MSVVVIANDACGSNILVWTIYISVATTDNNVHNNLRLIFVALGKTKRD